MARQDTAYVSEFTRFMNAYLAAHPEIAVDQKRGRALYWDKQLDFDDLKKVEAASVPADSYYYFGKPSPRTR
ncbi:MAG: DUF3460 family protein [Rhodocyclales bacterium]|nr:DUF3460 family protein [Rhodocyclales bacterium]